MCGISTSGFVFCRTCTHVGSIRLYLTDIILWFGEFNVSVDRLINFKKMIVINGLRVIYEI